MTLRLIAWSTRLFQIMMIISLFHLSKASFSGTGAPAYIGRWVSMVMTQGRDLLHTLGVETHGLEPPLTALPWILFNNVMMWCFFKIYENMMTLGISCGVTCKCFQEYSSEYMPGALNDLVGRSSLFYEKNLNCWNYVTLFRPVFFARNFFRIHHLVAVLEYLWKKTSVANLLLKPII